MVKGMKCVGYVGEVARAWLMGRLARSVGGQEGKDVSVYWNRTTKGEQEMIECTYCGDYHDYSKETCKDLSVVKVKAELADAKKEIERLKDRIAWLENQGNEANRIPYLEHVIDRLKKDLALNANMLARQCDLAKTAEGEAKRLRTKLEEIQLCSSGPHAASIADEALKSRIMTSEQIQDELFKLFPALDVDRTERGFSIRGRQMAVDYADAYMDKYIPTMFERGICGTQVLVDEAFREYLRKS
jgi:hypothetical protein